MSARGRVDGEQLELTDEPTVAGPAAGPTSSDPAAPAAVAGPAAENPARPVAKPTSNPRARPVASPTANPAAENPARPVAKPTSNGRARPVTGPTAENPAAENPARPVAKPTSNPRARPVAGPAADRPADATGPSSAGALARVGNVDWSRVATDLDDVGCASLGTVLREDECRWVSGLYDDVGRFRSTIDMARYRFGSGQYRYFAYPLPSLVADLRTECYQRLLPVARNWAARLKRPAPWPDTLDEWLDVCHSGGQLRPTPILLRYGAGDWNALHRDLYGELVFPLQVAICLDEPGPPELGGNHTGGEFMLVEQRPRAQSKGTVRALRRGEGLVFTTRDRPVRSARGWSASPVRHGVSELRSGTRHTLGLVLHDAT